MKRKLRLKKEKNKSQVENKKIKTRKTTDKTKSQFFEKINNINTSLAKLTEEKKKGHKLPISEMKEGSLLLTP